MSAPRYRAHQHSTGCPLSKSRAKASQPVATSLVDKECVLILSAITVGKSDRTYTSNIKNVGSRSHAHVRSLSLKTTRSASRRRRALPNRNSKCSSRHYSYLAHYVHLIISRSVMIGTMNGAKHQDPSIVLVNRGQIQASNTVTTDL